jgi:hypothetical protein
VIAYSKNMSKNNVTREMVEKESLTRGRGVVPEMYFKVVMKAVVRPKSKEESANAKSDAEPMSEEKYMSEDIVKKMSYLGKEYLRSKTTGKVNDMLSHDMLGGGLFGSEFKIVFLA